MLFRLACFLAFAGSGALAGAAQPAALSLEEAVARTLSHHPALQADAAEQAALEARAEHESLPPPLTLGGELENVAGTGSLGAVGSLEATVRVGTTVERGGKRVARRALGDARLQEQRNLSAITRRELEYRTTVRFHEVLADQQRLELAQSRLAQAETLQHEVEAWVRAARNPETDLHNANIAVADARLGLEHAEHELASARITLAAGWGAMSADFDVVTGTLLPLPEAAPFEQFATALADAPDQLAAGFEAQTIAAQRQLARSSAVPDVNVGLGLRRLEAVNEQALVLSFSMPLGSRARSTPAIAEADARRAASAARGAATHLERHQELFEIYQEMLHARTESDALREQMLPPARAALEFSRKGFSEGRLAFTTVALAQRTLHELLERQVTAAARYHMLLARLQRFAAFHTESNP